ncbi:hypothetical protein [Bacillus sp. T33-2]|uniref:hypothetical protein n=1 Tax=Bacillus sp. T33-2 TaxID=2054168 RepID=UPI000C7650A4|nr:hypothetical protein [Bacillus sp. T33-2]PLR96906.1 hypothetical protein CVD19_09980 [Bacillus sp. T33-2]
MLDSFINEKIQIKFKNLPEDLIGPITGIYQPNEWYLVKLIKSDNMGLWVENPCYIRTRTEDDEGKAIPADQQKEETCVSNLLIRWDYISSVITFPDHISPQKVKEAKLIGFKPDED